MTLYPPLLGVLLGCAPGLEGPEVQAETRRSTPSSRQPKAAICTRRKAFLFFIIILHRAKMHPEGHSFCPAIYMWCVANMSKVLRGTYLHEELLHDDCRCHCWMNRAMVRVSPCLCKGKAIGAARGDRPGIEGRMIIGSDGMRYAIVVSPGYFRAHLDREALRAERITCDGNTSSTGTRRRGRRLSRRGRWHGSRRCGRGGSWSATSTRASSR